jgi:hypothetical protein
LLTMTTHRDYLVAWGERLDDRPPHGAGGADYNCSHTAMLPPVVAAGRLVCWLMTAVLGEIGLEGQFSPGSAAPSRWPSGHSADSPLLERGTGFSPSLIRYDHQLERGHRSEVDPKVLDLAGRALRAESVLLAHNVVERTPTVR